MGGVEERRRSHVLFTLREVGGDVYVQRADMLTGRAVRRLPPVTSAAAAVVRHARVRRITADTWLTSDAAAAAAAVEHRPLIIHRPGGRNVRPAARPATYHIRPHPSDDPRCSVVAAAAAAAALNDG